MAFVSFVVWLMVWILSGSFWMGFFAFLLIRFFLMFSEGINRLTLKDLWDSLLSLLGIHALKNVTRPAQEEEPAQEKPSQSSVSKSESP